VKLVEVHLGCDYCGETIGYVRQHRQVEEALRLALACLVDRGWHVSRRHVWCPAHRRRRDRAGGGGGG
jgi:hypothetical protein